MRVLLFGATGKLGEDLRIKLEDDHDVFAVTRKDCDFYLDDNATKIIEVTKPNVIINAAAFNGMEACENDPARAYVINGAAPGFLAEIAKTKNIAMIHFSTNYVFDGIDSPDLHTEMSKTKPISVYSRSKFMGEQAVKIVRGRHLIFRLSTLYNEDLSGPLSPLNQAMKGSRINIFEQLCSPTSTALVARAVAHILSTYHDWRSISGIYHLTTSDYISREHFAQNMLSAFFPNIQFKFSNADMKLKRPRFAQISNAKFQKTFDFKLPDIAEDFAAMVPIIKRGIVWPPAQLNGLTPKKVLGS